MRIETLSLKTVTVIIFSMIGLVAVVLSLLAGSYFRQAAFDAQMNSLSRVIEVASQEMLKEVRTVTFDLGMRLGHSAELIQAIKHQQQRRDNRALVTLLDDPFVSGFVGFSDISLAKIRVYDLDYHLVAESSEGLQGLLTTMPNELRSSIEQRRGVERLKAQDVLWLSPKGPLNSTLVPVGGLHLVAYLEIVINPVFNLPDIGKITKTPVSIFSVSGEQIGTNEGDNIKGYLPVEYTMPASDGQPAFRIVGYENVASLNTAMAKTQVVTTSGFLLLTLFTLLFALWLFNRFLFVPLGRMILDMRQMAEGKLDLAVDKKGLREFAVLADSFDAMANQIKRRTNDLEQLLDLDVSAILCFGDDHELVYFNRSASRLFGYSHDEMSELEAADLFSDDAAQLLGKVDGLATEDRTQHYPRLACVHKDGRIFNSDTVINALEVMSGSAYAVVLSPVMENHRQAVRDGIGDGTSEQRMNAIEQSLSSLLEIARNNPGLIAGLANVDRLALQASTTENEKTMLREQAVGVMTAALACWEHDLGKTKLELADESKIWPVYIDKSTPTTRTLDKYLQLDSCPQNPRRQRVIDTAEFVLRKTGQLATPYRDKLLQQLETFRTSISGK